ncbi:pyrroloquinoline quinone biosynthesis protein D [Tistlia consotensis]|uniref:Pyrroloquinoline quinone biosynthesis protein D n=1 Tax=Tistlia consotensis USBA 355 TaxID=560819 RepID=A0A1Y6CNP7_9PROT|nr:pyrroloquinoline quinone biosynthesis peptide chaperone PqqD [Tistlia consotensis]SMF80327.1 pyrroloquinoline quinone biosynthesis protein D [Tistlia consotensis USBA 355]SNR62521.1 pyrroloquinoline quinone biosynthesis protein D [Tistlia consotensis]
MAGRITISEESVPRLPPGVKLRHDKARDQWLVQAPERVFVPDPIALEVIRRCNGEASVGAIVDDLAKTFQAPREVILGDVTEMLQDLADKAVMTA